MPRHVKYPSSLDSVIGANLFGRRLLPVAAAVFLFLLGFLFVMLVFLNFFFFFCLALFIFFFWFRLFFGYFSFLNPIVIRSFLAVRLVPRFLSGPATRPHPPRKSRSRVSAGSRARTFPIRNSRAKRRTLVYGANLYSDRKLNKMPTRRLEC